MTQRASPSRLPIRWPPLLLGVTAGGFFDGILLHQILQWHHLLSSVEAARDMRVQVLADGLVHAAMYGVAIVAMLGLYRQRGSLAAPRAAASVGGAACIGFGLWHVLDAVLSHWVTGIHRIRVDSPHPLAWDLAWFVVFGLVPIALGGLDGDERVDGAGLPVLVEGGVIAPGMHAVCPGKEKRRSHLTTTTPFGSPASPQDFP